MPCWRWRKTWPTARNSWPPRKPTLTAGRNCWTAPPFCTMFRRIRRAASKRRARPFICSSWRSSSITAATPSTRKAPTKPCCLTTSTISTTARSPRSRRMKSSNRCGSSWRNCAKCAPPARSTVIRCLTPCCTAQALRMRASTNSPTCSSARSKT